MKDTRNFYLNQISTLIGLKSANSIFIESKQMLADATLLVHPDLSAPLNITCDVSDFAVGEVCNSAWIIFGNRCHFSVKHSLPVETRYSAFGRELLAVYATIRHFRHNLEDCNVFVNTVKRTPVSGLM